MYFDLDWNLLAGSMVDTLTIVLSILYCVSVFLYTWGLIDSVLHGRNMPVIFLAVLLVLGCFLNQHLFCAIPLIAFLYEYVTKRGSFLHILLIVSCVIHDVDYTAVFVTTSALTYVSAWFSLSFYYYVMGVPEYDELHTVYNVHISCFSVASIKLMIVSETIESLIVLQSLLPEDDTHNLATQTAHLTPSTHHQSPHINDRFNFSHGLHPIIPSGCQQPYKTSNKRDDEDDEEDDRDGSSSQSSCRGGQITRNGNHHQNVIDLTRDDYSNNKKHHHHSMKKSSLRSRLVDITNNNGFEHHQDKTSSIYRRDDMRDDMYPYQYTRGHPKVTPTLYVDPNYNGAVDTDYILWLKRSNNYCSASEMSQYEDLED